MLVSVGEIWHFEVALEQIYSWIAISLVNDIAE